MRRLLWLGAALLAAHVSASAAAPLMIVGTDEKLVWDDAGQTVLSAPGRDGVLVVDLADPENPQVVANLPLKNSVVGPPVNLAIDPTGTVALVADSVDVLKEGSRLKQVADDKLHVIDLKASPPKLVETIRVGRMPSGLDIGPKGDMALVALRGDNAVGVLSIRGTEVKLVQTVPMNDTVTHVAFLPDGRRAVVVKFPTHRLAFLDIGPDGKVSPAKLELPTGQWPYNVAVSPKGTIALTADNGMNGASDGSVDTVSVVDLEAKPPRIIDRVPVGDGPEGLAISPKGDLAVAVILRGSNADKKAFFYNERGTIDVLRIDGKTVTKTQEIEVGGLPQPAVFTPDGRYLYIGNYNDQDFSIFRVEGQKVVDTGRRFKVPGHPASARMGSG